MKNYFYLMACVVLFIFSCDKELAAPKALFSFNGESSQIWRVGTNDEILLNNNSENSNSFLWRFGDGRISEEKDVVLSYPKSGTYEVKLTVTNSEGVKSELKKQVVVLDRVLKKIIIEHIQWNSQAQEGISFRWPTTSQADVFFQIQKFTDPHMEPFGIYPACPVIYTSPVIKDVNSKTFNPIEIPVNERIIMEKIRGSDFPHYAILENLNQVNLYSLMAKDKNGNIFNLYHNHGGGLNSIRIEKEDIKQNSYIVDFVLFSRIRLVCEYE